ncbi:MAG: pirin family protein [Panacagrimonas sp.]|jgi:redox-sensitive bicupin YhaK (pirin superfamily)|nr:pirin family protein [Panacagrimonas sp.]MCC2656012.1 pirin family protein [Panacagrimonas sp.]
MSTVTRKLVQLIRSVETSDGAGVKLRRSVGSQRGLYLDPFLMLDEFGTDNPGDYIAGFPPHPHRGFETVTYMLDGRMQHKDHLGNVGDLGPGGVQWMTAGRGVIHSEMPLQESGRMRGFQLWLNLPSKEKMKPAWYRDIPAGEIPEVVLPGGGRVKVIAGSVGDVSGPINGPDRRLSTDPLYLDLQLLPGERFEQTVAAGHTAFAYAYEGGARIGEGEDARDLPRQAAGVLSEGEGVVVTAGDQGARLVLIAGKPIREPIVQYGPFVMNTREEIEQAIQDYQRGDFARAAA